MSHPHPPTSSLKKQWLNRQLHKLGSKMQKRHYESTNDKSVGLDSAGVSMGNDAPAGYGIGREKGREVGFCAFSGEEQGVKEKRDGDAVGAKEGVKEKGVREGVIEVSAPDILSKRSADGDVKTGEVRVVYFGAGAGAGAGAGSGAGGGGGSDGSHGRTHGYVPDDGDSGNGNGNQNSGVQGAIGPHTALHSHPVRVPLWGLE
ncbi:uncharacterized protein RAG0_16533 [Rhynchosporium agropyri]|uniref:Uncharacterized protein n=1 Tax=Rhynchosporium agropyri TaxID=914238 RepID=A0A1E1LQT2_9HELO|nr:uncharacterized protein RAG0_16533 [Rhynchosporium agropyri]